MGEVKSVLITFFIFLQIDGPHGISISLGKTGPLVVFYKFDSANSTESRFNVLRTFRPKTALHWDQQLFRQNRKYIIKSNIINKQRVPIKLFWVSQQFFFSEVESCE